MTGGWRLAARLARREVRHRPGRTALVALPVTGMLLGVAFLRTDELSHAERWRFEYGRADAVLTTPAWGPFPAVPEGSRTADVTQRGDVVGTADGTLAAGTLLEMPFDPVTEGIVQVTSGGAGVVACRRPQPGPATHPDQRHARGDLRHLGARGGRLRRRPGQRARGLGRRRPAGGRGPHRVLR